MSIVTTVMDRLAFLQDISTRFSWLAIRLKLQGIPTIWLHKDRSWYSPLQSGVFSAQYTASKAYLEAQARFPIPR